MIITAVEHIAIKVEDLFNHKYFQITNAQNIVFKPFVECFNTSKLPLKCYI